MAAEIEYQEIENVLEQILGDGISFEQMVTEVVDGQKVWSVGQWIRLLADVILEQLHTHGQMIGYLFLLMISAAVLSAIAKAFRSRQISDMGFYMIYLLLFLIIMKSFGTCYTLTEAVLKDLMDFMKVLMPAYLMAAAAGAYRTSAVVYYEGFFVLIYYIQKFVAYILLPAIRCYVLFTMFAHLGEEDLFSKGREGMKKLILFFLKAMIGVTVGMQMIQGMITPAIDEVKHTAISRGVQSLGSMGNVTKNVTDVLLGSGMLLKNGIGVAATVVIIAICLLPAIQVLTHMLFYQILAAVSEPISDKRMINMIGEVSDGIGLLVKLLFSIGTMFLLIIVIVCITTGGIL